MLKPFRLAIAGLGNVGTGVVQVLQKHAGDISARSGAQIEIVAVSARDADKDRGVDLTGYDWVPDTVSLAQRPDIDCVVEVIGGRSGVALDLVQKSLEAGKHVVTANKALIAHQGYELACLAESRKVSLSYEAAVAGGIPAVKALREGMAANDVTAIYGILNGTSNYILSNMRETGRDFDVVLQEAQEKGYAEVDPSFDVDGVDAAHKICILASIAFGIRPDISSLKIMGIRDIAAYDIHFAKKLGYRIKLLGVAQRNMDGLVGVSVEPCLVNAKTPIGAVEGVCNAVFMDGDFAGANLLTGPGAGAGPTASAVLSDVIDIARGARLPTFGVPANDLFKANVMNMSERIASFYMRLNVVDQAGVLADVAAILRDHKISIESLMQHGRDPNQAVNVVITTHEARQGDVEDACALIAALDASLSAPCFMQIKDAL